VLRLCRSLYNTALEQRITAWQRRRVSLSRLQQEAELKELRAAFPEYAAIHSHVLQDVLARLDKTYQAFFRRIKAGEKTGFPRYQGHDRYHSFTYKEFGQWGCAGYWVPGPGEDWQDCRSLVPPPGRDSQDRHDQPGSGQLVCLLLVCGCASATAPRDWRGNGHRPGA